MEWNAFILNITKLWKRIDTFKLKYFFHTVSPSFFTLINVCFLFFVFFFGGGGGFWLFFLQTFVTQKNLQIISAITCKWNASKISKNLLKKKRKEFWYTLLFANIATSINKTPEYTVILGEFFVKLIYRQSEEWSMQSLWYFKEIFHLIMILIYFSNF